MFEHLCIAHDSSYGNERPLDMNLVLNSLLFYRHVDIVTSYDGLADLLNVFSPEGLHTFYREGLLRITYIEDRPVFEQIGRSKYAIHIPHERTFLLDWALWRLLVIGDRQWKRGEYWAEHLEHIMRWTRHRDLAPFFAVMNNEAFATEAVRCLLREGYPRDDDDYTRVEFWIDGQETFTIHTNLDDSAFPRRNGLTVSVWCLAQLFDLFFTVQFSAASKSEMGVDSITSKLLELHLMRLLKPATLGNENARLFAEIVLEDSAGVADAILSRDRSIVEYLELLRRADKFKQWLGQTDPNSAILRDYIREVSKNSWLSTLKGGAWKWLVFEGTEAVASMVGATEVAIATPLVDLATFIGFEHLAQGWRPHNFVRVVKDFAGPRFGGRSMRLGPPLSTTRKKVTTDSGKAHVALPAKPQRCAAITKRSSKCSRLARSGSPFCWQHHQ